MERRTQGSVFPHELVILLSILRDKPALVANAVAVEVRAAEILCPKSVDSSLTFAILLISVEGIQSSRRSREN